MRECRDLFLRWDHADIVSYYTFCQSNLYTTLAEVTNFYDNRANFSLDLASSFIENVHAHIVNTLLTASTLFVPQLKKNSLKFWWNAQMSQLKEDSVNSDRLWKAAGRPRSGPVFLRRQACRSAYRSQFRRNERERANYYSNALHESLLSKNTTTFWRSWRSKFDCKSKRLTIDNSSDPRTLVGNFANHFSILAHSNSSQRATDLQREFSDTICSYVGNTCDADDLFNIDFVDRAVNKLKLGKAPDLDGMSAEHFLKCHPIIVSILVKLFNLIMYFCYIPESFRRSYTIPLLKVKDYLSKSLSCADFRGIAISSVVSKVFEYCLLSKFSGYFETDQRQFGFKKSTGCSNAIYAARHTVDFYIAGSCTASLCALDVSKAFDKVNHHALFLKLMQRKIPSIFLSLLINWLPVCCTCVKWDGLLSDFFSLDIGVRQGSVLAPIFFAVCINDIIKLCSQCNLGDILVYADDILVITRSVTGLQQLIFVVENYIQSLDLSINSVKSCCMRLGARFSSNVANIVLHSGEVIPWVTELRYLGIYLVASTKFKVSFSHAKRSFCQATNAILGKIGPHSNEDVLLHLIKFKCMPLLLYATESLSLSKSDTQSIDFTVIRFLMKIFKSGNRDFIISCIGYFDFALPSTLIERRKTNFLAKLGSTDGFSFFC